MSSDGKVAVVEDRDFFSFGSRAGNMHILGADHEIDVDHRIIEGVFRILRLAAAQSPAESEMA